MAKSDSQNVKVGFEQDGDVLFVKDGGTIRVDTGGAIMVDGVEITAETLALTGLSASSDELNEYAVTLDIPDGSLDATYYVICPHAGTISTINTVTDAAVSTADITITPKIGATAITDGVVTIATAGSAAGDLDSSTPSALNVVTAGQAVNFAVAGGGSGGAPRIHLAMVITR